MQRNGTLTNLLRLFVPFLVLLLLLLVIRHVSLQHSRHLLHGIFAQRVT